MRIVITGNPNSGKTTLFNALTNKNARVGNWHGVTVSVLKGFFKCGKVRHEVFDLPGLTSFKPFTMEEKVSVDFLKEGEYDLIVNVIEAVRFDASIELTKMLLTLNKPIICIVNMTEDLIKFGGNLDFGKLKNFNITFYRCNLTKKSDVKSLKELISDAKITAFAAMTENCDFDKILSCFTPPKKVFTKADGILTNKLFCCFSFTLIILFSFYLSFGKYGVGRIIGEGLSSAFSLLGDKTATLLQNLGATEFTVRLVSEGIIAGFGALVGFLPPIIILNFVLCYLEQSGVIARISFVFDGFLSKFGLNGRTLFALIMGFGCTTVAVSMTNGLENKRLKDRLILGLPFISCSAKIPVYLYICSKLLKGVTVFALAFIYVFGIVFALLYCYLDSKSSKAQSIPLILELPVIRLNCLKNTFKPLINSVKNFIIKISTIVMVVSVGVWLLGAISPEFKYLPANEMDKSILAYLGRFVCILFRPIGIDDYKIGSAVVAGLFAKEAVLSTLASLSVSLDISVQSGFALLTFIAFYPPCITALDGIRKEAGFFKMLYSFVFQLCFGLFIAYTAYLLLNNLIVSINLIALSVLLITVFKVFKNERIFGKRKN